jgi:hypothetical protein
MEYLILSILSVLIISPLMLPWGKHLLTYSISVWFFLWVIFFLQANREISLTYDAGIISDSVALGFSIFSFTCVVAARSLGQFIWYKINENRNQI